jgi:predicted lactoylglutathione lyase
VKAWETVTAPGLHTAFGAASRAQVAAVHEAALASGAADLFTPRERPDIGSTYFGAMFSDLDGHRIEVKTDALPIHGAAS